MLFQKKLFRPVKSSLEADRPHTDGEGKGGSSLANVLVEHGGKAHLDLQIRNASSKQHMRQLTRENQSLHSTFLSSLALWG